jgi:hypothetical protein
MKKDRGVYVFLSVLIPIFFPILVGLSFIILIISILMDRKDDAPDSFGVVKEFFQTIKFGFNLLWEGLTGKVPLGL